MCIYYKSWQLKTRRGVSNFRKGKSSLSIYDLMKENEATLVYPLTVCNPIIKNVTVFLSYQLHVWFIIRKNEDLPKLYVPWDKRAGSTHGALDLCSWNMPVKYGYNSCIVLFHPDLQTFISCSLRNNSVHAKGSITSKEKSDKDHKEGTRKERSWCILKLRTDIFVEIGRKDWNSPSYDCDLCNALPKSNASKAQLSASSKREWILRALCHHPALVLEICLFRDQAVSSLP
jgi:hypothetical protein